MNELAHKRVLLIEDSPSLGRLYLEYLRAQPYTVEHVERGADALAALDRASPDAVLLDLRLPDMDGMEVLRQLRLRAIDAAVVVITAHGSINIAVDAMRGGAADFLVKPFTAERLTYTLKNALEKQQLVRIVERIQEVRARSDFHGFIGSSAAMQGVYRIIEGAAPSRATVFITGESGTGKELCAEAIHNQSDRGGGPFVAINCAAIPRDLIESEIFGHAKGAFTGAVEEREGAAARSDGGTLFLDEICEMDIDLQSKLLRFVQTGMFQKVGGNLTQRVDVRFVCATNQDPSRAVAEGRFREDLFYRLNVIPIELPALRDRGADMLQVAEHFLDLYAGEENKQFTAFDAETQAILRSYDWPGNVRQLQNVVRNVVVLNDDVVVTRAMLPAPLGQVRPKPAAAFEEAKMTGAGWRDSEDAQAPDGPVRPVRPLWQVERAAIEQAIAACDGHIPKAAVLLGISPSTIYRKRQGWLANDNPGAPARQASER